MGCDGMAEMSAREDMGAVLTLLCRADDGWGVVRVASTTRPGVELRKVCRGPRPHRSSPATRLKSVPEEFKTTPSLAPTSTSTRSPSPVRKPSDAHNVLQAPRHAGIEANGDLDLDLGLDHGGRA